MTGTRTSSGSRAGSGVTVVVPALYYTMLAAFLVSSFFPEYRVWGLSVWAPFPLAVKLALFAVGLAVPFCARWCLSRMADRTSTQRPTAWRVALPAVMAGLAILLFWLLRTRTHFLGDGYTLLSLLARPEPILKSRELGESLIHLWLTSLSGLAGEAGALISYRITSIAAGAGFLSVLVLFAKKLFNTGTDRFLFVASMATGGWMLLFFGYVENYSVFVVSLLIYVLMGLHVARNRASKWWMPLLFSMTVFFHIFGLVLLLSTVYMLCRRTSLGRWVKRLRSRKRLAAAVVVLAFAAVAGWHVYSRSFLLQYAMLPPSEGMFTINDYTLLSWRHLLDYVNLLLLLLPGLIPIAVVVVFARAKKGVSSAENTFLLTATLPAMALAFGVDPKLGMARDWDLFAFAAIPLAVYLYLNVLSGSAERKASRTAVVCAAFLGVLSLVPRAITVAVPEWGVVQFRAYLTFDGFKDRNARCALIKHYNDIGEVETASRETAVWEEEFPERQLLRLAKQHGMQNEPQKAITLLTDVIRRNPSYFDAWSNMGTAYLKLRRLDSAEFYARVALEVNPYDASAVNNMGMVSFHRGDLERARRYMHDALALDPNNYAAQVNLALILARTGPPEEFAKYLFKAAEHPEATGEIMARLGDYHLRRQEYERAAEAYKNALNRGLDSSYMEEVKKRYPQISNWFE